MWEAPLLIRAQKLCNLSMTSPLGHYLAWFDSLPKEHQNDIAMFGGMMLPGFEEGDPTAIDGVADRFRNAAQQACSGKLKETGLVLSLINFTEFVFISQRSSREGWARTEQMLDEVAEETGSENLAAIARQAAFRREQWLRTCEKWLLLRKAALSDIAIRAWAFPGGAA